MTTPIFTFAVTAFPRCGPSAVVDAAAAGSIQRRSQLAVNERRTTAMEAKTSRDIFIGEFLGELIHRELLQL